MPTMHANVTISIDQALCTPSHGRGRTICATLIARYKAYIATMCLNPSLNSNLGQANAAST